MTRFSDSDGGGGGGGGGGGVAAPAVSTDAAASDGTAAGSALSSADLVFCLAFPTTANPRVLLEAPAGKTISKVVSVRDGLDVTGDYARVGQTQKWLRSSDSPDVDFPVTLAVTLA